MDESRPVQNRRFRRSKVFLSATLELPAVSLPVVLRDLSQEGALVQGKNLPDEDTRVLFHRQGLCVPSHIVWSHGDCAGLEFDYPLFPREMLRHVPTPAQKPPISAKKRPGLSSKPLSEAERMLIERWATEGMSRSGE